MAESSPLLGSLLQHFFAHHLVHHKHASPQTIASYRDTFRLLLEFFQQKSGIEPSRLRVTDLDVPTTLNFLDYLELNRRNSVRSRNLRLSLMPPGKGSLEGDGPGVKLGGNRLAEKELCHHQHSRGIAGLMPQ